MKKKYYYRDESGELKPIIIVENTTQKVIFEDEPDSETVIPSSEWVDFWQEECSASLLLPSEALEVVRNGLDVSHGPHILENATNSQLRMLVDYFNSIIEDAETDSDYCMDSWRGLDKFTIQDLKEITGQG